MTAPDPRLEEIEGRQNSRYMHENTRAHMTADVAYLLAELRKAQDKLARAAVLIRDLTDPDNCEFDHHGGCQAHGYLSLEPGETCPQHDAKQWAAVADATGVGE